MPGEKPLLHNFTVFIIEVSQTITAETWNKTTKIYKQYLYANLKKCKQLKLTYNNRTWQQRVFSVWTMTVCGVSQMLTKIDVHNHNIIAETTKKVKSVLLEEARKESLISKSPYMSQYWTGMYLMAWAEREGC